MGLVHFVAPKDEKKYALLPVFLGGGGGEGGGGRDCPAQHTQLLLLPVDGTRLIRRGGGTVLLPVDGTHLICLARHQSRSVCQLQSTCGIPVLICSRSGFFKIAAFLVIIFII
jgi:hypothetical protein